MNFFSDGELRTRQDLLDGQWNSLMGYYNSSCENGLGGAFPEFATDYRAWKEFYASGSDWSSASKHETDAYQSKAQEWSKRLSDMCGGSGELPGVKDNPPDEPGLLNKLGNAAEKPFKWLENLTLGVLILGGLALFGVFWLLNKHGIPGVSKS